MGWGFLRRVLLGCVGLLLLAAGPAPASTPFPAGSTCHAAASAGTSYTALAAHSERWSCDGSGWSIAPKVSVLRFDLRGAADPPAGSFVTRLTRFESMRLTVIGANRRSATRTVGPDDMSFATFDWVMSTPLPGIEGKAEALVVEINRPRHSGMLSDARIAAPPGDDAETFRLELLLAGLCGLLFMPLLFDLVFFRVLKERFLLWHAAAVGCMLVHTFVTSGLINRFFAPTMLQLSLLSAFSWAGGLVTAGFFIICLVERGKLDRLHRRLMHVLALWIPAWSAFYLFSDGSLRPLAPTLYFASFLPVLGYFIWIMAVARRRGSRAINFQIAAWLPIMVTGALRILSSLGVTDAPMELMMPQHISIALEVMITSLGVADRFLAIRRQRDRAVARSLVLEKLAERDPLTGLFNRHGIEERFEELRMIGFNTMAVIDLDHFKHVNDNHGHAIGDRVLQTAARALMPDEDTLAVRMGGEEFLLLLRGNDAADRAERRRQMITARVANEIPGMEGLVTASMGMVEQPLRARIDCDFAMLYAHCDRLLYEAKRTGRNRTMREKMQRFGRRPGKVPAAA